MMADIWCVRGYAHEVEPPIEEDCPMCESEDEIKELKRRLRKSKSLLRKWRDKFGGRAVHVFPGGGVDVATASPSDLLRDTNKFLEGK